MDHLVQLLQKRTKADWGLLRSLLRGDRQLGTPQEMLLARQKLKEAAEQAKIDLSQGSSTVVTMPEILGTSLNEEITLVTYNKMISPLVEKTIAKTHDVLKATGLKAGNIDRVILVGGSTRNKLVKERVAEAVKPPFRAERVDEAVAQGAAIVAGYHSTPVPIPQKDFLPVPLEFSNVTPFSLGVRAAKGKDADIFRVLVPKNSSVPAEANEEFTTFRTNQKTVDISVFQGEHQHCRENTFVGGFRLEGIPQAPAGQPKITVRFRMDNSDLLTVSATCSNLHNEQSLDVNLVSREDESPQAVPQADIMFWVDTSGSMSSELEGVKRSCLDFTKRVQEAGVDCRVGLLDFALSSKYLWEIFGPMDPSKLPSAIAGLAIGRLAGGGCYVGAANALPVVEAFANAFPSSDRLKIGILISDEVGNDAHAIRQSVEILQHAQICLHVVGVARSCHEVLACDTQGRFWDIAASRGVVDFSQLLDAIAVEITNLAIQ